MQKIIVEIKPLKCDETTKIWQGEKRMLCETVLKFGL